MKIRRAQHKKVEDIDPKFLCCEAAKQSFVNLHNLGHFDIDLDTQERANTKCSLCDSPLPETTIVLSVMHLAWTSLEILDIDEGIKP